MTGLSAVAFGVGGHNGNFVVKCALFGLGTAGVCVGEVLGDELDAMDVLFASLNVLMFIELFLFLGYIYSGKDLLALLDGDLDLESLLDSADLVNNLGHLDGLLLDVGSGDFDLNLLVDHDGTGSGHLGGNIFASSLVNGDGLGASASGGSAAAACASSTAAVSLGASAVICDRDDLRLGNLSAHVVHLHLEVSDDLLNLDCPLDGV